jgi:hypothetical protein
MKIYFLFVLPSLSFLLYNCFMRIILLKNENEMEIIETKIIKNTYLKYNFTFIFNKLPYIMYERFFAYFFYILLRNKKFYKKDNDG